MGVTAVRVLTVHQPWASLIQVGAKSIETRSWPTKYRGQVLIHAGLTIPVAPGAYDPGARIRIGEWAIERLPGPVGIGSSWAIERPLDRPGVIERVPLPLGAVVASAMLTDCVPIVNEGEAWDRETIENRGDELVYVVRNEDGWALLDRDDQLPFGDFTPGRWAWLLDDVKPTTERCPRCWGTGGDWLPTSQMSVAALQSGATVEGEPCGTCEGAKACEPVPMRGKQGLWQPAWP